MLEIAMLEYQTDCYEKHLTKVNWKKVNEKLDRLEREYSSELRKMVELMLKKNPKDRLLWSVMQFFVNKTECNLL
jgi:hypothetical protein